MTCQELIQCKMSDEADLEKFKDMLNDSTSTCDVAPMEYCTSCLICGESIAVSIWESPVKICEDCKKAIMCTKERFKGEYTED